LSELKNDLKELEKSYDRCEEISFDHFEEKKKVAKPPRLKAGQLGCDARHIFLFQQSTTEDRTHRIMVVISITLIQALRPIKRPSI